ncbi:MAG: YggT family protein [Candidatus Competibacteraceae bacterium]
MNGALYFNQAGQFLLQLVFGFYILALLLRFLLQWARADFYNPLVQLLVKLTNPPLLPLRRYIPGYRNLDMAAIVLMLLLQLLELLLSAWLFGQPMTLPGLLVLALAELLGLLLTVLLWAVIFQAVLSWFNPDFRQPVVQLLYQLTEPVLRPARRLLPPFSGLDLSPLLVIIALQLGRILLLAPLQDIGLALLRS